MLLIFKNLNHKERKHKQQLLQLAKTCVFLLKFKKGKSSILSDSERESIINDIILYDEKKKKVITIFRLIHTCYTCN